MPPPDETTGRVSQGRQFAIWWGIVVRSEMTAVLAPGSETGRLDDGFTSPGKVMIFRILWAYDGFL